jgi:hypothetical protein
LLGLLDLPAAGFGSGWASADWAFVGFPFADWDFWTFWTFAVAGLDSGWTFALAVNLACSAFTSSVDRVRLG